jgi:hypothetical protein
VVLKLLDSKSRVCSDPRSFSLNDETDLEAIYEDVGLLELPSLLDLANLVVESKTRGDCHLSKFDVFLHSTSTSCIGPWWASYLMRLTSSFFGWSAFPTYYDLISTAVDWELQGRISAATMDQSGESGFCCLPLSDSQRG